METEGFKLHRLERTVIMGVLNATPDSFSGDGLLAAGGGFDHKLSAILLAGADIVDVGGESTRPGFVDVPVEEELRRVLPVVRAAVEAGARASIDTRKAEVARQAVRAGAVMINDVSCLSDEGMAEVAAEAGAHLVLLHNRPIDRDLGAGRSLIADFEEPLQRAMTAGVPSQKIVLDPGLGFGKTWRDNLAVVRDLRALTQLGFPILIGPSRKGTISRVLGVERDDRLEGSLALVAACIANGADIVRVHDVLTMRRAATMVDAVIRGSLAI